MHMSQRIIAKPVLVAFAAAALITTVGAAAPTLAHADVSIDCSIPLNVQCTVSDPAGISSIVVQLQTGLGLINVVDESYDCVTSATVSWDPIVPGGDILVTTCDGIAPPRGELGYADESFTYELRKGQISRFPSTGTILPRRPGLGYILATPMNIVRRLGESVVMRFLPSLKGYTTTTPQATLAESSYCCPEGSNEGCFPVNLLAQCGEGLDYVHCTENENGGTDCETYPN